MRQAKVISIRRTVAVLTGIAALMLAAFGCSYLFFSKSDFTEEENLVSVSTASNKLPRMGLENALPEGVKGLILVSGDKDNPVITAVTPKGTPINLCGSKSKTECKLVTTASALAFAVSGTAGLGFCEGLGTSRQCHMEGTHKDKWYWHSRIPDNKSHVPCDDTCQP